MNWIKHIITDNKFTLALKYCPSRKKLVIGGRLKFYDLMKKIMNKFQRYEYYQMISTFPNHSTIRCETDCDLMMYDKGMKELKKDDSVIVQSTTHLGRIMR